MLHFSLDGCNEIIFFITEVKLFNYAVAMNFLYFELLFFVSAQTERHPERFHKVAT